MYIFLFRKRFVFLFFKLNIQEDRVYVRGDGEKRLKIVYKKYLLCVSISIIFLMYVSNYLIMSSYIFTISGSIFLMYASNYLIMNSYNFAISGSIFLMYASNYFIMRSYIFAISGSII